MPVGDGRLEAAASLHEAKYNALLKAAQDVKASATSDESLAAEEADEPARKRVRTDSDLSLSAVDKAALTEQQKRLIRDAGGAYSVSEAQAAYSHLSDYHKKKGWDSSGWWARKG